MFLSDFSVKRPLAMVVIIIALMFAGLLALTKLRVNQIPDVEQPVLVVTIPYPGASPETVERELVNRIEKSMQTISGVDKLRSTSKEGSAEIVLIFNFDKNMVEAADEVRNAIGAVRHKLPLEMREPVLTRMDPGCAADHGHGAVEHRAVARHDLAPGRRRPGRPLPRHSRRVDRQRQRRAASASCRCCCAPRSCASSRSRSPRW